MHCVAKNFFVSSLVFRFVFFFCIPVFQHSVDRLSFLSLSLSLSLFLFSTLPDPMSHASHILVFLLYRTLFSERERLYFYFSLSQKTEPTLYSTMTTTLRTTRENQAKRRALGRIRERVCDGVRVRTESLTLANLPQSLIELSLSFLGMFDCSAFMAVNRTLNRSLSKSGSLSPATLNLTSKVSSHSKLLRRYRRVQRLSLSSYPVEENIKEWLIQLPQLVGLSLELNSIHENGVVFFLSSMTRLRSLSFTWRCTPTTTIPFLSSLSSLASLTSLHIEGYHPPLSDAVHLPPLLQSLRLRFDDSVISEENDRGLAAICSLYHLHTVEMWEGTQDERAVLRMITILESLPSLTDVWIPYLHGTMRPLRDGSLPHLTHLTLDGEHPIHLSNFGPMRSLTSLRLTSVKCVSLLSISLMGSLFVKLPPLTEFSLHVPIGNDELCSEVANGLLSTHTFTLRSLALHISRGDSFDYRVIRQLPSLTSLTVMSDSRVVAICHSLFSHTVLSPLHHLTLSWVQLDTLQVSLIASQCLSLRSLVLQCVVLEEEMDTLSPILCPLHPSALQHLQSLSLRGIHYLDHGRTVTFLLSPFWRSRALRIVKIGPLSGLSPPTLQAIDRLRTRGCAVL